MRQNVFYTTSMALPLRLLPCTLLLNEAKNKMNFPLPGLPPELLVFHLNGVLANFHFGSRQRHSVSIHDYQVHVTLIIDIRSGIQVAATPNLWQVMVPPCWFGQPSIRHRYAYGIWVRYYCFAVPMMDVPVRAFPANYKLIRLKSAGPQRQTDECYRISCTPGSVKPQANDFIICFNIRSILFKNVERC